MKQCRVKVVEELNLELGSLRNATPDDIRKAVAAFLDGGGRGDYVTKRYIKVEEIIVDKK